MTCASCVARVEKTLNNMDSVTATVNLATSMARVTMPDTVTTESVISAIEKAGYSATVHTVDSEEAPPPSPRTFIICALLTIPVALLSMIPALQFPGWQWVSLALSIPVVTWGAWGFHRTFVKNLRHLTTTMDTLVSLGVIASFGWSLYALIFGGAGTIGMTMDFHLMPARTTTDMMIYFEVACVITTVILIGRYLEARATSRSSSAIRTLLTMGAQEALVVRGGEEILIDARQIVVGDSFLVRPGDKVATDGVILDGESALDLSLLTGESMPKDVGPGDEVIGATINTYGRLLVEATRVGADTQLAHMSRLLENAQLGKSPIQRLADRISAVFVPIVLALSALTLIVWILLTGNIAQSCGVAVSVLVVACPCALGIATPAALMVGTGRGAQLGILVRGLDILESTRKIDTIVLDKTGTLTTGKMQVIDIHSLDSTSKETLLTIAAGLEVNSTHPLAQGIVNASDGPLPPVSNFTSHSGYGVEGKITHEGFPTSALRVGKLSWLEQSARLCDTHRGLVTKAESVGHTVVGISWDNQIRGLITLADGLKETSTQAVHELKNLGLTCHLVTGDNQEVASQVASHVDINNTWAGVLPEDKVRIVADLQSSGRVVAMIGDGVNDAAALAQADLGIAMGTGSDVAIEASDITLLRPDLLAGVDAIRLGREILRRIKGNLFWAFAYNVAAIPLAMAGFLNPMIAGAAMALSDVIVVWNSLLLARFSPTTPDIDSKR
ncbi:MAG: heavy metal translocating P-type ATPase [Propionibacteriaceae bacterium]|nr:heavy metal translocating P-type ATPase [Propionibacteriaceae bacterium]